MASADAASMAPMHVMPELGVFKEYTRAETRAMLHVLHRHIEIHEQEVRRLQGVSEIERSGA